MSLAPGVHDVPSGHVAAVVTHLRRTAPPGPRPPAPEGVALRRETALTPESYRALFTQIGRDWLWAGRLWLGDTALTDLIRRPDLEIYRVVGEAGTAGVLELDFSDPAWPALAYFGLAPGHTGRGLGSWLMGEAVARSFARGAAGLTVHTCTLDSPRALAFYMAHDFVPVRREIEIMRDPRAAGLLDEAAAPGVPRL